MFQPYNSLVFKSFFLFPLASLFPLGLPVACIFTVWNRERLDANQQFGDVVTQRMLPVTEEMDYEFVSDTGSDYADYYILQQFESAKENPLHEEDAISEETKTKFKLPKSRTLTRNDKNQLYRNRNNFKSVTERPISLEDMQVGETIYVEVVKKEENLQTFQRQKTTNSKGKYKMSNVPHTSIKARKLRGSEISIIESESGSNMPVFPNFPQVQNFKKLIPRSAKQKISQLSSYTENSEYPQKFISDIATLVSNSWN